MIAAAVCRPPSLSEIIRSATDIICKVQVHPSLQAAGFVNILSLFYRLCFGDDVPGMLLAYICSLGACVMACRRDFTA